MKLRTPLTVILVASVTVGAIWLFNKPAPAVAKTAETSAPVAAPKAKTAPVPQIAMPVAPPAPIGSNQPAMTVAAETPAPINNSDTHADLNAAIDDITNMLQSGNISGLIENYAPPQVLAQMPPDAKAQMEQMLSDPRAQQQLQMITQVFQGLKGVEPTMNDAGDRATYQIAPPAGVADNLPPGTNLPPTIPITFVKQDGRWYISDGPGGGF